MGSRGVLFDLVAVQSPSYRGRGIARYSADLVRAMVKYHPELVAGVVLHRELDPPEGLEDLAGWVTTSPSWEEASVLHLSSVIEPEVQVRTFWPREASQHGLLIAVTLYDLIPDLFPGWYLEDPGLRRRWRCCRETVRAADRVLTLSERTRQDAIALLGLPPQRVRVVGSAPSEVFRRPESRRAAFELARSEVDELEEGFVVYNGAFNPRKNMDRLLQAYACLPRQLIDAHQLVIVCEAPPLTRNHYLVMAKELGIGGRLLITGFVPDEVLVALYQSAELAIYPSLYEGYGLPLVESMTCGTPTVAGNNSSLVEILPRFARFEPEDPGAIAEAIARGLTDEAFRARLIALTEGEPPSWEDVAERAADAFEGMLAEAQKSPPRWRRRLQLALVGLPPELSSELTELANCDLLAGLETQRVITELDRWRGGYDAVVVWVGAGAEGKEADKASKVVERFVAAWPGRCIALAGQLSPAGEKGTLSKLAKAGASVLRAKGAPVEVARLVLEAATPEGRRGACS